MTYYSHFEIDINDVYVRPEHAVEHTVSVDLLAIHCEGLIAED